MKGKGCRDRVNFLSVPLNCKKERKIMLLEFTFARCIFHMIVIIRVRCTKLQF